MAEKTKNETIDFETSLFEKYQQTEDAFKKALERMWPSFIFGDLRCPGKESRL